MRDAWDTGAPGVVSLPSGRLVRGRGLRRPVPAGPVPEYGVYVVGRRPRPTRWPYRWVRWPDFLLPVDPADAREAIVDLWARAPNQRVEVACTGGQGRTGTVLACLAVLDGVPAADAVSFVRGAYGSRAVETPWQRRWVQRFEG